MQFVHRQQDNIVTRLVAILLRGWFIFSVTSVGIMFWFVMLNISIEPLFFEDNYQIAGTAAFFLTMIALAYQVIAKFWKKAHIAYFVILFSVVLFFIIGIAQCVFFDASDCDIKLSLYSALTIFLGLFGILAHSLLKIRHEKFVVVSGTILGLIFIVGSIISLSPLGKTPAPLEIPGTNEMN